MRRIRTLIMRPVWGLAVALAAGCASTPAYAPQDPAEAEALGTGLTAIRAGYVDTMLDNIVGTTSHNREGEVFAIVADYGGGYVTTASMTGVGGTPGELLTFDTVLGATSITDRMQGETYLGPSAIACFRFTLGYYGRQVSHRGIPCPAGTSSSAAATTARRQTSTAQTARILSVFAQDKSLPLDLAAAQQDGIGVPPSATASSSPRPSATAIAGAPPLGPSDFATATGVAALSVPQPGGACVYLRLTNTSATNSSPRGVSVYGWAAPTQEPCTGQAALTSGSYVSADPYAGG